MKRFLSIFSAFVLLLSASPVFASYEQTQRYERLEPPNAIEKYGMKVGEKFDFGVPNFLMGWTNILTEPGLHRKTSDSRGKQALSVTGGALIGVGLFVVDTVGGAVNILTSPIPVIIPLPRGGVKTAH